MKCINNYCTTRSHRRIKLSNVIDIILMITLSSLVWLIVIWDIIVMMIVSPLVWLIVIVASVKELFNSFTVTLLLTQSVNGFKFLKQILGAPISNFWVLCDSSDIFPRNLKKREDILLLHQHSPVCACVCVCVCVYVHIYICTYIYIYIYIYTIWQLVRVF